MDNGFLGRVKAGDERAIANFKDTLLHVSLHQSEITRIWSIIIDGMRHATEIGDVNRRSRLMDFTLWLSGVRQEEATRSRYEDLAAIYGLTNSTLYPVAVTRTAATVAKVAKSDTPGGEVYLMLAKDALLMVLEHGEFENRKTAAAGLAHIPDPEVRAKLTAMAQHGPSDELKEAAGESIAAMRNAIELNLVISDRDLLLDVEYPDQNDPRRECLEQMLDAARVVLEANGREQGEDYAVAVKQLSVFGSSPDELATYFYGKRERRILARMMEHTENALLRAVLRANDDETREEAARGLESIGSDRVEGILEKMACRIGEDSKVGRLVTGTLETIMMDKCEIVDVQALPPKRPRPAPRRKRIASDPKQVLKVKL